jgi:hypothetical protein
MSGQPVVAAFRRLVAGAKQAGETSQDIDVQTAAEFLLTTISGMKVAARRSNAGKSSKHSSHGNPKPQSS